MKYLLFLTLLVSSSAFAIRSANFQTIVAGNLGNSTVTGSSIDLEQMSILAVQAVWTGAPVGNMNIQVSDDAGQVYPDGSVGGVVNWSSITGSDQPTGGSAGNFSWNLPSIGHKWGRLNYTRTSGTGTMNARAEIKGE